MIKKKFKGILSTLLVGIMVISLVSGCTKKEESTTESNNQGSVTEENSDDSQSNGSKESLYPISDGSLTLSYWVPMHFNAVQYIESYNENETYQELEKRTGIHINFIHPATGQEKEQFNIMIAAGDLPDIIGAATNYPGGEFRGVSDGVFADLDPYLEKNAPDYLKVLNSDEELKREITGDDGVIAGFYRVKLEQDPPWRRVILRQDWLDELGLEIPRTIDDYERMFEVLKEQKDVVPYAPVENGMEDQFAGVFGVISGLYLKDEDTVAFGQIQPEFKDYLALMNKWYEAGYISKDFPSLQAQQVMQLFDSEQIGMFINSIDTAYSRAVALDQKIIPAPHPRIKLEDQLHNNLMDWPKGGENTVISSTSKYKEEAIQWLNYAYTEEGSNLFNYGVEGKSWVMENGTPKFTEYMLNNPDGLSTTQTNYILKVHFAPKLCAPDVKALPNIFKNPGALEMRTMWSDDPNVDAAFRIPPIRLTKEELDRRATIMTEVNTYSDEMVLKFIFGAEPLSNFDQYVDQMKKLGIDEAIEITQVAYDRYMGE